MRKIIKPFICTVFMLMLLVSTSLVVSAKDQRVFDDAGLLKDSEINKLEEKIDSLKDKYSGYDFVVLTTDKYIAGDPVNYAESFYFDQGHNFDSKGFMLLIDMNSRVVTVSSMGDAQKDMNTSDNDKALDNIQERLKKDKYYKSVDIFLSDMGDCIDGGVKRHVFHQLTIIEILVAIIVPVLVFVIFVATVKKKYGKEGECQPYPFKERGKVQLTHKDDVFVREYTTHVKIQSSSGGGGGGGSSFHSSSSGRSSGGSRGF